MPCFGCYRHYYHAAYTLDSQAFVLEPNSSLVTAVTKSRVGVALVLRNRRSVTASMSARVGDISAEEHTLKIGHTPTYTHTLIVHSHQRPRVPLAALVLILQSSEVGRGPTQGLRGKPGQFFLAQIRW